MSGSIARTASSPIFRTQRRLQLRRRRRLDDPAAAAGLQPAAGEGTDSHRARRPRRRGVRDPRAWTIPIAAARRADVRVDVPPAAAHGELEIPERRDVGRPRIEARPGDPRRSDQPGRGRGHGSRAGRAARAGAGSGDRRLRARAVRDAGRRSLGGQSRRRRRTQRSRRARTRVVLHRHQRSARHAAVDAGRVRRVVGRSRIRSCSRCFADGRTSARRIGRRSRAARPSSTRAVRHRRRARPERTPG